MKIKEQILRIIPAPLIRMLRIRVEKKELQQIPRLECDVTCLKSVDNVALKRFFASHEIEMGWRDIKKRIDAFVVPDMTGGVNLGDRKAIYFLIR